MKNNKKYQDAERFFPWNLQHHVFNSTIFPYWSSEALYYFQSSANGTRLIRVDLKSGKKKVILDFMKLMNAVSLFLNQEINDEALSLDRFSISESGEQLFFPYQNNILSYDLENEICSIKEEIQPECLKSPDEKWVIYTKDYNVFLRDTHNQNEFQITTDGIEYYDYASSPETNTRTITQRLSGEITPPIAIWSADSTKIITHKLDQRRVRELFLLQNAPENSQRPQLHAYRMSFTGDDYVPTAELMIIDFKQKKILPLKMQPILSPYLTPIEFKWVWFGHNNEKMYFICETRASKKLMLYMADTNTGDTTLLISESAETYIEPSQLFLWPHQIIVLEKKNKIIWLSERSGYSHLYLYEPGNDKPKLAITNGEWCVREVLYYDEKENWLYFIACGYYPDLDPYYKQLFRCHLDGTALECLTKENAHHTISISLDKNYFLDTWSTIETAPVSVLKSMNGNVICHIEKADLSGLTKLNWKAPLRFCVNGRDGKTPIFGNMYFPSSFDPKKKYPVIDHIYPGPQVYRTSPYFSLYGLIFRSVWPAQALAELGFIVVHVDGFGTPGRSRFFHHLTYKKMGDCSIPDHVEAIKQLAEKFDFIDVNKIGITGYSGGAYAAARAMLMYPEFYKVGVAAGGNHDLRCYPASYGEKYNSLDAHSWPEQSNACHAEKLKGKLMLIHGEMDDNVHPCATLQLVDALIRHNKNFDMLIMPNQNHRSTFDHPYYMRKLWDYFVIHLLEETPPESYSIKPMPEFFPQLIDW